MNILRSYGTLGNRRAMSLNASSMNETRLIYHMPSRGLIGMMTQFLTATKGYGVLSHMFLDYRPMLI